MRRFSLALLMIALVPGVASRASAAGNGAGAGGAGFQRAINSGLPPGEPGPPGSVNNPHRVVTPPAANKGTPQPEAATDKGQQ